MKAKVKVRVEVKSESGDEGGGESEGGVRVRMRVRREHGLQPSKCRASDAPAALAHIVWRAEDDGDALVHVLRHQVHDARLACGREAARLLDEVGHGRGLIQQPDLAWCGRGKGRTVRIRIRSRAKARARARARARVRARARAKAKAGA